MDIISNNLSFLVMMFLLFITFLLFLALLVAAIRWLWFHAKS
nr:MAG TPA: hypothetical protein [Microviridae sp.]